jgi:glycosyltransferase involved in cell wall biosynthesis
MGMGKPVIVTAGEENTDIPATACLRVDRGIAETEELLDHMVLVSQFPGLAREIGENARYHIREHHSLGQVARQYRQVLCAVAS